VQTGTPAGDKRYLATCEAALNMASFPEFLKGFHVETSKAVLQGSLGGPASRSLSEKRQ
jgi:hypothetical protein